MFLGKQKYVSELKEINLNKHDYKACFIGRTAEGRPSHARGPRFEPVCLHHNRKKADDQNGHRLFFFQVIEHKAKQCYT